MGYCRKKLNGLVLVGLFLEMACRVLAMSLDFVFALLLSLLNVYKLEGLWPCSFA